MVSRPHLSIVPANGLGARMHGRAARVLVAVAIALAAVALLYAAARFTSLFALRELEVTGARPKVREAVRQAVEPLLGTSLVELDQNDLRRRLEAIPTVRSVRLDRAFPHTLRIAVVREQPLAVVRSGSGAWLVSERGRVIKAVERPGSGRHPVVWAPPGSSLAPGSIVRIEDVQAALAAVRRLPEGFPGRVQSAQVSDGAVTLVLSSGMELRLGRADELALKLAVAARVLKAMSSDDAAALAYLDVSVPERAVGGTTLNSQLEG